MKGSLQKRESMPQDIQSLLDTVPEIQISSLYNDLLHHQNITSRYSIVLERFDCDAQIGTVEILSENNSLMFRLTEGQYRYFYERPLHRHDYLEVMMVISGSVRNYIEDTSFVYQAGQGCIMNTNIRHKELPLENAEVLFIGMQKDLLQEMLTTMDVEESGLKNPMLQLFLQTAAGKLDAHMDTRQYWDFSPVSETACEVDAAFALCLDTLRTWQHKQPGGSYLIRAAILRLLDTISDPDQFMLQNISYAMTRKEFLVSKVAFLAQASYGRITQDDLEKYLSYHADYLNRCFKELKGKSISDYCSEITMKKVKQLLENTQLSVDEIMEQMHITSRGHFFKKFREGTGMTPRQYRLSKQSAALK